MPGKVRPRLKLSEVNLVIALVESAIRTGQITRMFNQHGARSLPVQAEDLLEKMLKLRSILLPPLAPPCGDCGKTSRTPHE